jgi:glycosyltransferase involved in cell wall biosynthesis
MHKIAVVVVGPSAETVSGSLLRPANIYRSLKGIRNLAIKYIPVGKLVYFLFYLPLISRTEVRVIIISGVNPWISAIVAFWGSILKKKIIMDFHGFAWLEASITESVKWPIKVLLLITEKISYRLSYYITVASKWLFSMLVYYFGNRENNYVIENSVPYMFEHAVNVLMKAYRDAGALRAYVCRKVLCELSCDDKLLLVAPLPAVFKSNVLAFEELLKVGRALGGDALIVVTGIKGGASGLRNVIVTGYLSYVDYVALLLSSDGVILPYPSRAICGGARNKVLEAGFCGKPVFSTKAGMMHMEALPNVHYVALERESVIERLKEGALKEISVKLNELVKERYSFVCFKRKFLRLLVTVINEFNNFS